MHEVIIIGSGPAGLTAAIYAARANLKPLVLAGITWGGQLMNTTEIENFPGFINGIMGPELMDNMMKQAERFGAQVKYEFVNSVDLSGYIKKVVTDNETYQAKTVIIATGATPRKIGIPGEDKFYGHGVSTCATCDAPFYKGKIVAVVGGGDSAMEESLFLSKFVSKLFLIHRKDNFRASKIMQDRVKSNPNIEILFNTEIKEILGDGHQDKNVEKLKLFNNKDNSENELKVDGLFLAIGHTPVTTYIKDQVELDEQGYVKTGDGVHTSVEGVFVAGDVQDITYRQAITAAGAGCKAALEAQKFLEIHE